jgi:hypothetical protein
MLIRRIYFSEITGKGGEKMSKKTKTIGAVLVVLALVVAGVVGMVATASAAEPTPTPTASATSPQADLLARVAEILGIDKQKVTDAFTQARQEMAQKALDNALAQAVAEGRITQARSSEQRPASGLGTVGFPWRSHLRWWLP